MDTQTCKRLLWQIPVLILIIAWLSPGLRWYSSAIGAWPLWLMSMPVALMVQQWLGHKKMKRKAQIVKTSQVLVFNNTRVVSSSTKQGLRQAA